MQHLQVLIIETHRWATTLTNPSEIFECTHCRDVSVQLTVNRNRDPRRFNLLASDEVAVIVQGTKLSHTTAGILLSTSRMIHSNGSATDV
ncbi:hypothetical protein BDM02DRAFT_3116096 [Thelephora ganbajun]|uniref:Uncharacterized protein n=1 Tax=Thelephora ganbajun TaxID=370292 RepID=A0ACB6ZEH8_THEGA|nr:hypothetical protein BDM02DRAFT_3116096 [Thelephora ganbajun]